MRMSREVHRILRHGDDVHQRILLRPSHSPCRVRSKEPKISVCAIYRCILRFDVSSHIRLVQPPSIAIISCHERVVLHPNRSILTMFLHLPPQCINHPIRCIIACPFLIETVTTHVSLLSEFEAETFIPHLLLALPNQRIFILHSKLASPS